MNSKFWNGKKVLVTGHTGFKGSWLSLWLQSLGADLLGYSLPPPTDPCLFDLADVGKGMTSIVGDVRDGEHLKSVLAQYRPEIFIHMAAQSLVVRSHANPVDTYSTNVMGTVNALEAIRLIDCVKVAIVITSDKCYENKEWQWGYRENEVLGGADPYSNSKACAEMITSTYRRSYFGESKKPVNSAAIATVRAGNVIAGGDWAEDRLIPDVIRAFMDNRSVKIRNPDAIRPWQFVLEPLDGYLTLAEHLWVNGKKYGCPWNFGPNEEDTKTVSWVVGQLVNLWGGKALSEEVLQSHPREASHLKLDCSNAKASLGWSPKLRLITCLDWVTKWYQAYAQNKNIKEFTINQIQQYQKK